MSTDPTQDTVPNPALARPRPTWALARFVRSVPGAFVILALFLGTVIGASVLTGYEAGLAARDRNAATAQAVEVQRQYDLGVEDMAAGRYSLAAERFEYIVGIAPGYADAASRLAEARAAMATPEPEPTAAPSATPDPQIAPTLLAEAQAAFAARDWDGAIQKITALRLAAPDYEWAQTNSMLFKAFRNRGIAAINDGKLELGLSDLDQAEKIGPLDAEAQQYRQWAVLYINGAAYWGLNWPRTIETFTVLHTIAPYFRDTKDRLHDAHAGYGNALNLGGDPCGAALEYAAALNVAFRQRTEDRRLAAETTCALGTPTPDPSAPTPDGTLTPFPPANGTATATGEANP